MDRNIIQPPFRTTLQHPVLVKAALLQGIVAVLPFAIIAIVGGWRLPGYSHVSQEISELTEAGAANMALLDPLRLVMELRTALFGLGFLGVVRGENGS